jgi:hypothetical protein
MGKGKGKAKGKAKVHGGKKALICDADDGGAVCGSGCAHTVAFEGGW